MAYDPALPYDNGYLASAPAELRELFRAIKEDRIVNAGLLSGREAGNTTGDIPLNNGTLNANLNADLLDNHDSDYFAKATHTHSTATANNAGFMGADDKTLLGELSADAVTGLEYSGKNYTYIKKDGTTLTVGRPVHRYTIPANASKVYYRIAQSSVGQLTPMHCQFIVRAKNVAATTNYMIMFVDLEIYGNQCGLRTFGNNNTPLDYIRVLYENTAANVTNEKLSYIDLRPNIQNSAPIEIEIEEIYNDGMVFAADGAVSASVVPSGYENRTTQNNGGGIYYATSTDYATYVRVPYLVISTDITLESSWTHTRRVLFCTAPVTLTVNQTAASNDRVYWVKNASSGVVTIHPATTSILFDNVNGDITLQPDEWIRMSCQSTNHYVIVEDGRWKSQKLDAGSSNYVKSLSISGKNITVTKGDNSTATLTTQDTTYDNATQSAAGLMSAADKAKLDALAAILDGGQDGQVLVRSGNSFVWIDLEKIIVDPTEQ